MKELIEEELEHLKDKVYWVRLSADYVLPESFIRKYQNKVYWSFISLYQKLSEEFIIEFQYYIYYPVLLTNNHFMKYHNSSENSESFQKFILDKLIGQKFEVEKLNLTPYMRQLYEKMSIFM
jgi:hypothetical protein